MSDKETFSIEGPICPHCGYKHIADEPHYFNTDSDTLWCENCDMESQMDVSVSYSWTCVPTGGFDL